MRLLFTSQEENSMSILKSLTFTVSPQQVARNPKLIRRHKLVDRLQDQLQLAKDSSYAPMVRRWKRAEDGVRSPVDIQKQIRPWWRADGTGNLVLVLRSGLKTLELEKGKPAVLVGSQDKLGSVLETLIAAANAGELDAALEAAANLGEKDVPKRRAA
jgi:hypothetical protein